MLREANEEIDPDDVKDEYGYSANDYANMSAKEFKAVLDKLPQEMPVEVKQAVGDAYKVAADYPIDDKAWKVFIGLTLPEQLETIKKFMADPKLSDEAKRNL